jgi:hypothetical protein
MLPTKKPTNKVLVQGSLRPDGYTPHDRIATGEDKAKRAGAPDYEQWCMRDLAQKNWTDALVAYSLPVHGEDVIAYINRGRWVGLCPQRDCAGSELVDPDNRVFMCLSCGNIRNKDEAGNIRLHPVRFPGEHREIEYALLKRPDPTTRNWFPNETRKKLLMENLAHGIKEE